jgi:rubredoxin
MRSATYQKARSIPTHSARQHWQCQGCGGLSEASVGSFSEGVGRLRGTIVFDIPMETSQGGDSVAIELTGGVIVNERGTVVTFRQKCENCGYVFDWNKTTIVPAFSSRKVRPFTCPQCGNYQEVEVRYLHKGPRQEPT